jgi:PAS domain-containing protein
VERIFDLSLAGGDQTLTNLRDRLKMPNLRTFLNEVIETGTARECEVQDRAGSWYSLQARPYQAPADGSDGVMMIFHEITSLKRSEAALAASRDYAEATLRSLPIPFLILDENFRVETASAAFCNTFRVMPMEIQGQLIYDLGGGQWNIPRLRQALEAILPRPMSQHGLEVEHVFEFIGRRTMLLHARRLESRPGERTRIFIAIEDITERLLTDAILRRNEEMFVAVIDQAPVGVYVLNAKFNFQHINPLALPTFRHLEPLIGRNFAEVVAILWPPDIAQELIGIFRRTLETGEGYTASNFTGRREDLGERETYEWEVRRIVLPNSEFGLACYFSKMTKSTPQR